MMHAKQTSHREEGRVIPISQQNARPLAPARRFCSRSPGNTADCVMAQECVSLIPGIRQLLADKGYDTDAFRAFLKQQKIRPVIPGKSNRKKRIRHDRKA